MAFSIIENGVLVSFDKRDLVNGEYTIPDGITEIGDEAFDGSEITKVNIPESVTSIGERAFWGCTSLRSINIPNSVTKIGKYAFAHCSSLTSISLPESLTSIEEYLFKECRALVKVDIPESVASIGYEAFANCRSLTTINIPSSVTNIGDRVFSNCRNLDTVNISDGVVNIGREVFYNCINLQNINLPNSLRSIGVRAFESCLSLTSIRIPQGVTKIEFEAFSNCEGLLNVEIPDSVIDIERSIFSFCSKKLSISLHGKNMTFEEYMRDEHYIISNVAFYIYAKNNKKFLPKNTNIMKATKMEEIENYYTYSKEWRNILKAYVDKWQNEWIEVSEYEQANLYQVCLVLGVFQPHKSADQAEIMDFIEKNILTMTPLKLHSTYGGLDTRRLGYNEEFAKFYITNYHDPITEVYEVIGVVETPFLYALDEEDYEVKNYTSAVYNNWKDIKKHYPNKSVLAHREDASENNTFTEEDVLCAVNVKHYDNVREGNEEMHNTVNVYGYTQEEFETLQDWWDEGKVIPKEEMTLRVSDDVEDTLVKYELLDKNNPEGLIIGEKTNCCQVVNDAGRECLHYGATKRNSGFVKFTMNGRIIGQSWVWYNEKTGTVCLDNIEIPTVVKKRMRKDPNIQEEFMKCLVRLSDGFVDQMTKAGQGVKNVVIGKGYNDLDILDEKLDKRSTRPALPKDYDDYTDTKYGVYQLSGVTVEDLFGVGV